MRMCRSSMLRPSLNHGTLWLHDDDDGDDSTRMSREHVSAHLCPSEGPG